MNSLPSPPKGRRMSLRALKALQACRRYFIIDQKIKEVTRKLGDTICTAPGEPEFQLDSLDSPSPPVNCIDRYYYGPNKIFYDEMCMACRDKHTLIQHRKELRRKLGAAKRWITTIGKEEGYRDIL